MQLSARGLDFIKRQEGCVLHPYNDQAGYCTIGYGHLLHMSKCTGAELPITQGQAELLLASDVVQRADNAINAHVSVPVTQAQYDALSSLVFNIGGANFQTSTLLRKLNLRDYDGAAAEFSRWNHASGVVLSDLTTRRAEEKAMFLEDD